MKRLWLLAALAVAASAHADPPADQSPPTSRADHRKVITNPSWVRSPTGDELASDYPSSAMAAGLSGFVRMECDVTAEGKVVGCVAIQEDPPGKGFGQAAVKMSRLFRMKPETRDGVSVGGAVVTIPMRFSLGSELVPPQWVTLPTPDELLSVWPTGAPASGGLAKIGCVVTEKAKVQQCSVLSETPEHSGFATAAIKLSPKFRLSAATLMGSKIPVTAATQLTIAFVKPPPKQVGTEEFGAITQLHNAPWLAAPTNAEMAAAWPKAAPASLDEVKVRVRCGFSPDTSLTGCELLSEDPPGNGLGAAAIRLTEKFRTRGALMEDSPLAQARIYLWFDFLNPKTPADGPVWMTQPNWVSFIPEDRMTALYPTAAADAGVKTGRGVVDCTVAPSGALTDCTVSSEDPEGKGFGPAALAAITSFAVNPWSNEGRPHDGEKIRVPIRFVEAEPAPPADVAPAGSPAAAKGSP